MLRRGWRRRSARLEPEESHGQPRSRSPGSICRRGDPDTESPPARQEAWDWGAPGLDCQSGFPSFAERLYSPGRRPLAVWREGGAGDSTVAPTVARWLSTRFTGNSSEFAKGPHSAPQSPSPQQKTPRRTGALLGLLQGGEICISIYVDRWEVGEPSCAVGAHRGKRRGP